MVQKFVLRLCRHLNNYPRFHTGTTIAALHLGAAVEFCGDEADDDIDVYKTVKAISEFRPPMEGTNRALNNMYLINYLLKLHVACCSIRNKLNVF